MALTECNLLVNCCWSDATAQKYLRFFVVNVSTSTSTGSPAFCSRLYRPAAYVKLLHNNYLDEINIRVVDYTQFQNLCSRNNYSSTWYQTKTYGCRMCACCLEPSHSSYPQQAHKNTECGGIATRSPGVGHTWASSPIMVCFWKLHRYTGYTSRSAPILRLVSLAGALLRRKEHMWR